MSYNLNFSVYVPKEALSPELREMFGLEPGKDISVRKLTPEELKRIRNEKFDDYEIVL